jgi:hypothetical protein
VGDGDLETLIGAPSFYGDNWVGAMAALMASDGCLRLCGGLVLLSGQSGSRPQQMRPRGSASLALATIPSFREMFINLALHITRYISNMLLWSGV